MASVLSFLNGIFDVYMYTDTNVCVCGGGLVFVEMVLPIAECVSSRHELKCKMAFSKWGYPLGLYSP